MARKVAAKSAVIEEMRIQIPRELLEIFDKEQTLVIKKFLVGPAGYWPVDPMALGKLQQLWKNNKVLQEKFDIMIMPR